MSCGLTGIEKELLDTLFDVFNQSCYMDGKYNHCCLSAYENAQEVLIRYGVIKPEECRYKL